MEDTTADCNFNKFTESKNDKSVVNNQESGSASPKSGSASPHTSLNSFSNYDPESSEFMSDFLINSNTEHSDDSGYIPKPNKGGELVKIKGVKVIILIKYTHVISVQNHPNQNNNLLTIDAYILMVPSGVIFVTNHSH